MPITDCENGPRNRGQLHPKAILTDHEVELLRRLREEEGGTYNHLAKQFEISKNYVVCLCTYRTR